MLLSEYAAFCDVGCGCELCPDFVAALDENSSSSSSSSNICSRLLAVVLVASGSVESGVVCEFSSVSGACAGAFDMTVSSVSMATGGNEVECGISVCLCACMYDVSWTDVHHKL